MLKSFLFLTLSMAAMSVSCAPAVAADFEPQIKTASSKEIIEIVDPECVIPLPAPIKADTCKSYHLRWRLMTLTHFD
jgi:hypothetical protein